MNNKQPNIEKLKWDLDKAHAELGKAIDTLRDIYHYGGAMRGQWAQEKTERTLDPLVDVAGKEAVKIKKRHNRRERRKFNRDINKANEI